MQKTFTAHYSGNRQPIGLYTHPIHLSVSRGICWIEIDILTGCLWTFTDDISGCERAQVKDQHDQCLFGLGTAATER